MAKKILNSSNTRKKKKKSKKSGPDAVAMKLKTPKDNPFETIWSRRKFDILGKKRKGEEHRVGLARSRAIEKRKKTLLKEYEQSGKSSVFLDKRIGEQNDALGEFDKAIMRSQVERQLKLNKKSRYNLSDGEEDELDIQGLGSFLERDDFEDEIQPDDDDDTENAGTEKKSAILKHVGAYNVQEPLVMGSMEGEDQKHKSKKDVMEEIISKSKYYKAQKAKDKEENEQFIEQLDKNFTSLTQSAGLLSLTQPSKMSSLRALVGKGIPDDQSTRDELPTTQNVDSSKQEQPDSYDKLVKEMGLEMRARPSDRRKTHEEIAEEERERLERLEEERQKRMLANDDSSDEDDDAPKDVESPSVPRIRSISGDDLGDSFSFDEESKAKKGWIDEILEREEENDSESKDGESSEDSESAEDDADEEGSDEGNGESEKNSLKDWEQSDDEDFRTDLEEGEEDDEGSNEDEGKKLESKGHKLAIGNDVAEIRKGNSDSLDNKKITSGKQPSTGKESLPFVIQSPSSFEELSALLENRSNVDILEAISRIRKSSPISSREENRKKMQVFYGLLLQYFAVLSNKKPLNFILLNLLVKPLMEMSAEVPYFAAICARERILRTRMQLCEALKNTGASCWPSLKTLGLLRLWSMIFPCSDFRHVVMTPALLLICEYLMRCPIMSGRDVAIGSFLCSMVLSVAKQSRKFCPEAIMFLQTLLVAAMDRKRASCLDSQFNSVMQIKAIGPLLCIQDSINEFSPLDIFKLMDMAEDSPFFSSDCFRAGVLLSVIETLRGFVDAYEEFNSFPEIFLPISTLLFEVAEQQHMLNSLQDKFKAVAELIKKKAHEHYMERQPLQMRKQKPVPIKLLNPKFEENFVKGRDYDPDRERAERRKLKKLIKQEARGAIRELRKDNYFLYEVKEKEKALVEEERVEKYGRALAFLQEQEHAFKSGQPGKGRKRRR
ncbi:uncharacterized protein LOC131153166 [Malania oleifera]|uniref:uncharacterized protein LOC131153166 n=1 Tax=Malania oleifera TaxID=397392 RepID=UPI0025ADD407|nr:uncharacterized protein LOC131153166 [Malania oleifera]XP_057961284.1 uncharacterized protein LOC131153166 [Malania oleifera]